MKLIPVVALYLRLAATLMTLCLFLRGFFPMKKTWSLEYSKEGHPYKTNLNVDLNRPRSGSNASQNIAGASHPRVILMIIDAFREDFAYGPLRYMPLSHNILNAGHGLKFTAETMPPTVTLPRIKALVTGSTSSFADVILNFGSPVLEEDNIISRLKENGRAVIFYGDDTWLKLFPQHFERSAGTTSFFVSDYTEVDNNVTHHLQSELENVSWDVMILHYLGLDHIGHFAGPRSPLIAPKLAEMDGIIHQIYTAMEQWPGPSVLIVCGDHGMSDQGGHGGATPGEISVPLIFFSPQINNADPKHRGIVSQTDLCPTLSVLLGVPIPQGNIGQVITEALTGYSLHQKVTILHHNAQQAIRVLGDCVPDLGKESAYLLLQDAERKLEEWHKSRNKSTPQVWQSQGEELLTIFSESLSLISAKVSKLSTQYDVYAMAISIVLMWMILVSLVFSYIQRDGKNPERPLVPVSVATAASVFGSACLSHILMCTEGVPSNLVCSATVPSVLLQASLALVFLCLALHIVRARPSCSTLTASVQEVLGAGHKAHSMGEVLLVVGTVAHTLSLMSSSFVEEEHQTFYFLTTALHLLILLQLAVKYARELGKVYPTASPAHPSTARQLHLETSSSMASWDSISFDASRDEKTSTEDTRDTHSGEFTPVGCNNSTFERLSMNNVGAGNTSGCIETQSHHGARLAAQRMGQTRREGLDEGSVESSGSGGMRFLHWAFSVLVVLLMLRVSRRWNHTGNKWLHTPDFGDWLLRPQNKGYLSMLTVFSFMIIGASCGFRLKRVQAMCVNLCLCCAYLFRAAQGTLVFPLRKILSPSGILEARASYFFIGLTCLISLLPENFLKLESDLPAQNGPQNGPGSSQRDPDSRGQLARRTAKSSKLKSLRPQSLDTCASVQENSFKTSPSQNGFPMVQRLRGVMAAVICFACLVKQPHNAPVAAMMSLTEQLMTPVLLQIRLKPSHFMLYSVWMGHVFFFLQGNSNSLSTVDIAAAYVGMDSYWPEVNGLCMFATTYVSSLFWALALLHFVCLTCQHQRGSLARTALRACCPGLLLTRVLPLSLYMCLVAAQRYHLFVWSVFSPKLLYEAASTVAVVLEIILLQTFSMLS